MSYAWRRPNPSGAEGIGSWKEIQTLLSWIGVAFNVYLGVFTTPLCDGLSNMQKLMIFVSVEHAIFALKLIIERAMGNKKLAQQRIEEHHDLVLDRILTQQDSEFKQVKITSAANAEVLESPFK